MHFILTLTCAQTHENEIFYFVQCIFINLYFQQMWKLKKISRVELINNNSMLPRIRFKTDNIDAAEVKTREFDAQSMHYLSYLLYPIVISGAVYSLLYQPHKRYYMISFICNMRARAHMYGIIVLT